MTLKEKIGQMLMFAHHETEYGPQLAWLVETAGITNFIHFARNIESAAQIKRLNAAIAGKAQAPLFIALDQEGGIVRRVGAGITYLPGAMAQAASALDPVPAIYRMHKDLKALGFNFNFAPVADINSNPHNPVINSRAFSDDPQTVTAFVLKTLAAQRRAGVLGALKHFPGHGDVAVDSHIGLPVLDKSKEALARAELVPFKAALAAPCAIMSGHLLVPALDPRFPATLSPAVLGLLDEAGFSGLKITDSLTMGALWGRYSLKEIIYQAVLAGNDLLVFCGAATPALHREIIAEFTGLVESGAIPEARLDQSVAKILAYKSAYLVTFAEPAPLATQELVAAGLTLIGDRALVPLKREEVLVFEPESVPQVLIDNAPERLSVRRALQAAGATYNTPDELETLLKTAPPGKKLLVVTYNYQAERLDNPQAGRTLHVAWRSPFDYAAVPAAAHLFVYDYTRESLAALAEALVTGVFPGKAPVKIAPEAEKGAAPAGNPAKH